ncbi:MAG: hypothetical protein H7839_24645 [Magnetococcus sp. YQC-5]
MDAATLWIMLSQGGPTVPFLILGGLMWMQQMAIASIRHDLEELTTLFNSFQVNYANERVRKADLDEIKELIKEANTANKALIARIFERLDDHVGRCGKDCLASLHASAEFQMASAQQMRWQGQERRSSTDAHPIKSDHHGA